MQNCFKRILSFFYEIDIERIKSPINGELQVCWSSGRKVLHSHESNYSFGSLHYVLRKALIEASIHKNPPQNALILGLGAGSAVHILHKEWKQDVQITGIEKDPQVLALGKKHFDLVSGERLRIFETDACAFVKTCDEVFDLVLVDIFVGKKVPKAFETEEFWDQLRRILKDGGTLLFNKILYDDQSRIEARQLQHLASKYFQQIRIISIPGIWENFVVVGRQLNT